VTLKIRLLAWIYIVLCGGALLIGTAMFLGLMVDDPQSRVLDMIGPMFAMVALFYLLPGVVGGIGLLQGKAWGRVLLIVLSSLALLGVPIGTLFGAFALWILLGADANRLFAAGGVASAAPASGVTYSAPASAASLLSHPQAGLVAIIVAVGSGFVVMLGTGSRITGQPDPEWIPLPFFIVAIALLIGAVSLGVKLFLAQPRTSITSYLVWTSPFSIPKIRRIKREMAEERRQFLARLRANPRTKKYADAIERGEFWDEAQVDYDVNPQRLATCVHIQPIERAMRLGGIPMKYINNMDVRATCVIDPVALRQRFTLPESVFHTEPIIDQRSAFDPPSSWILCNVCRSIIDAVHHMDATPQTPVFPKPL
jgi:hypothetical protein